MKLTEFLENRKKKILQSQSNDTETNSRQIYQDSVSRHE